MKKPNLGTAADILLTVFMSFTLTSALLTTLNFDFSPLYIILVTLLFTVLFMIISYNRKILLLSGMVFFIILTGSIISVLIRDNADAVISSINDFIIWIPDYANGYEKQNMEYVTLLTFLITVLNTLVIYIFSIKIFNFYVLLTGGIAVFVIQIIFGYRVGINYFYFYVFLILIYYIRFIYARKSKNGGNDYARPAVFYAFTLPICIIIFLTAFAIPKSPAPLEWEWLDRRMDSFYDFYNKHFRFTSYDYFSFSKTGFSKDDDRLGGKVELDNTAVLDVITARRNYLLGSVKDIYTGSKWTNSMAGFYAYDMEGTFSFDYPMEELSREYHFDMIEPFLGIALFKDHLLESYDTEEIKSNILGDRPSTSGANLRTYQASSQNVNDQAALSDDNIILTHAADSIVSQVSMEVKYLNLRTKTIFKPSRAIFFTAHTLDMPNLYIDSQGMLASSLRLRKGFTYVMDNYSFDYTDDTFIQLLKKSYKGLYSDVIRTGRDKLDGITQGRYYDFLNNREIYFTFDDVISLDALSEKIYDKYTLLPDTVTERVVNLTREIAGSYDNDYDKAKAIETFLASNYPYTLDPPPTPNDSDFVDFFLFEAREGYCVYYASAMTVMARILGMPARYVEGYMLPPPPSSQGGIDLTSNRSYIVTNRNAHAWVEIYFEGFGWIPFEPTAPFTSAFYRFNSPTGQISQDFAQDPYYEEYMEMLEEFESGQYEDEFDFDPIVAEKKWSIDFDLIYIGLLYFIVFGFMLLLIVNRSRNILYLKRIRHMPVEEAIISMTTYYLKIMAAQNNGKYDHETANEYVLRLEKEFSYEKYKYKNESYEDFSKRIKTTESGISKSGFRKVLDIYTLARYGKTASDESMKDFVLGYYDRILIEAKGNLGIFKYFTARYLKGIF